MNQLMIQAKKKLCDGCGRAMPIWKNSGGKRFCKQCWGAHSKPKPTPIVKQKKLPPRSPKRIKLDVQYSELRKKFLIDKSLCEAHIPGVCTQLSTDVHHKAGRSGDLYLDQTHWLSVCRSCHMWIESRPEDAKKLGFSITRLDK